MRIGRRLALVLLPALVGMGAVTALAYWGERGRQVPELVLVTGIVATVVAAALAVWQARGIAARIERLGRLVGRVGGSADELERVEAIVARFDVESARLVREADAARVAGDVRAREAAVLAADAAALLQDRVDAVRLPLQILLENRFGELNENQEELLGAAREAADDASRAARAVAEVTAVELGAVALRHDRLAPGEVLRALAPSLEAAARRAGVPLVIEVEPGVPAIAGDAPRLHEALRDAVAAAIGAAPREGEVRVTVRADAGGAAWAVAPGAALPPLVRRRLEGLGVRVAEADGALVLRAAAWGA